MIEAFPLIQSGETRPFDLWFDIPGATDIDLVSVVMYDVTDNTKTNVASSLVAAQAVNGDFVRIVFSGVTIGKTYAVEVAATDSLADVHRVSRLLKVSNYQTVLDWIPDDARKSYTVDFADDLPDGVNVSSMAYVAYDISDTDRVDVSSSLVAGETIDEQEVSIHFENGVGGTTYVITATATTAVDSVTSIAYTIVKTLILPCKDR